MVVTLKGHTQVIEVPEDRAKSAKEGDTKDHVIAVKWNGVTVDGELTTDADSDISAKAAASDTVNIGHDNTSACIICAIICSL